jgi:hypothetical protein
MADKKRLDETQITSGTRGIPPVQHRDNPPRTPQAVRRAPGDTQPVARVSHNAQKGTARHRRDNALYLPLWSLALMILVVIAAVFGIVAAVLSFGGDPAPEPEPVVVVSSPVATQRPDSFPVSPATPTLPDYVVLDRPVVTFGLEGPTLQPVQISPTPRSVAVGLQVRVVDVGLQELNVREVPGVRGTVIVFRADEGTVFDVVDGPEQSDGLTWWKIADPLNATRTGWAAANYLEVIAEAS